MLRGAQDDRHDVIAGIWSDVLAIMVEGALMCQELRATCRGTAVERTCKIYRKYVRRWLWKVDETASPPPHLGGEPPHGSTQRVAVYLA